MYISYEDLKDFVIKNKNAENPGIFIKENGEYFPPKNMEIDVDGDIVIEI